MRIHCLQHVAFETPAYIADWARARRHALTCTLMADDVTLPRLADIDLLLVMGGPMSVHDAGSLAWLADEKQYLARAIAQGKRVVGVCLGAQLIAEALGAPVTRNRWREIGWFPLLRAPQLPPELAALLPSSLNALHWHGETFALPAGAVRLAGSSACANQVFLSADRRQLGLQCHLEMTPQAAADIAAACAGELVPAPYVQAAADFLAAPQRYAAAHNALAALLDGFLALPTEPRACASAA